MAKCIKYISNAVILRMSDDHAASLVKAGVASYTSKGAWKAYVGDTRQALAVQAATANKIRNKIVYVPNPNKKKRTKTDRHMGWKGRLAA